MSILLGLMLNFLTLSNIFSTSIANISFDISKVIISLNIDNVFNKYLSLQDEWVKLISTEKLAMLQKNKIDDNNLKVFNLIFNYKSIKLKSIKNQQFTPNSSTTHYLEELMKLEIERSKLVISYNNSVKNIKLKKDKIRRKYLVKFMTYINKLRKFNNISVILNSKLLISVDGHIDITSRVTNFILVNMPKYNNDISRIPLLKL